MSEVFTARTLAKRWHCTTQTVYNLRAKGELHGFKLGGKLWRIRAEEVEQVETIALVDSREDGLSSGRKVESENATGLFAQEQRLRRELHSETLPTGVTRLHGRQEG